MNMKNTVRNGIAAIIATGYLITPQFADKSLAEENTRAPIKASLAISEIIAKDKSPVLRNEVLIKNLPVNTDLYLVEEHNNKSYFSKQHIQAVPLKAGNFGFGAAAQHVSGNSFKSNTLVGPLLRITGKPIAESFAKIDIRYLPETHTVDTYGLASYGKGFADLLGAYNTENGNLSARIGMDYELINWKNSALSAGFEGKFKRSHNNTKTDYAGIRVKANFP